MLKVRSPDAAEIAAMKKGAVLAALLAPYTEKDAIATLAAQGVTAFAMEFIPRNHARPGDGRAVVARPISPATRRCIDAAATFGRAMPMMMTAAGTIAPARVFIMGVGVAGLQAIATARRLGAIVSATDVRPATKEQVEILGATFVAVDRRRVQAGRDRGRLRQGNVRRNTRRKQAALSPRRIKKQDIVITTALIPGRKAPVLVTEEMVKTMKPGSVIVDLAVEQGGNCPLSKPDEIVEVMA